MDFVRTVEKNKKRITQKWVERVIETYPAETAEIFGKQKDRFANPVAGSLSESLEKVVNGLVSNATTEELSDSIDPAIRVRAVQKFSSSEAVAFIFFLKKVVPEVVGKNNIDADGWAWLDKKVEELALIGFDKYVECREKIFELRAFEVRNRIFKAFDRAGLVDDPEVSASNWEDIPK